MHYTGSRSAFEFPSRVPVCQPFRTQFVLYRPDIGLIKQTLNRTNGCSKTFASHRLNLLLLKGQRYVLFLHFFCIDSCLEILRFTIVGKKNLVLILQLHFFILCEKLNLNYFLTNQNLKQRPSSEHFSLK